MFVFCSLTHSSSRKYFQRNIDNVASIWFMFMVRLSFTNSIKMISFGFSFFGHCPFEGMFRHNYYMPSMLFYWVGFIQLDITRLKCTIFIAPPIE